jgi:hypothetical protein
VIPGLIAGVGALWLLSGVAVLGWLLCGGRRAAVDPRHVERWAHQLEAPDADDAIWRELAR